MSTPDQTMRERVAEAIAEAEASYERGGWEEHLADAALTALAAPTPAMVKAGAKAQRRHVTFWDHSGGCLCGWKCDPRSAMGYTIQHTEHLASVAYMAMIAAAWEVRG